MDRIRLEITCSDRIAGYGKPGSVRGYIVRDALGVVWFRAPDGTPEALSNIVPVNSEHVRFCIEDAGDENAALKALRPHLGTFYLANAWRAS